jgi:hypothetical protein
MEEKLPTFSLLRSLVNAKPVTFGQEVGKPAQVFWRTENSMLLAGIQP